MSNSPIYLATCFDSGYASRARVMIDSSGNLEDRKTKVLFLGAEDPQVLAIFRDVEWKLFSDLLERNTALANSLIGRTWPEQIFTTSPSFLLESIGEVPEDSWLVYADADVWFQVSLEEYLKPFSNANVVITRHRHYPWNSRRLAKYGEFNVGVVAFRNNANGRKVLENWAKACLDWCLDSPVEGKYADQKYLESFADWADGVVIDERVGANLAPWNSSIVKIARSNSEILVKGEQALFFHMQGLNKSGDRWLLGHLPYFSLAGKSLKNAFYKPYIRLLEEAQEDFNGVAGPANVRISKSRFRRILGGLSKLLLVALLQSVRVKA